MLQGFFSLFNSKVYKQVKISAILIDDFAKVDSKKVTQKLNKQLEDEINEPSIDIIDLDEQKIIYTLKGFINSDKNFQKSVKRVKTKKEFTNGILYIRHYVEIKESIRKEHNNICYFTYSKEEKRKFPKNTFSIKVELFEGIISTKNQTNYNLIAEQYITI